jgi:cell wall-associated NlpC family hydrolase
LRGHLGGMRTHPILPSRLLFAVALTTLLGLAGCAGSPPRVSQTANDVLFRAIGLVGTPYRYGGNTPQAGFDCSGLVGYVFQDAAGLRLPRTSKAIADMDAPKVKREKLAPGDLVFFGKRGVDHIGIYVGEGRFVHAPNAGGTVRLDSLDGSYWKKNFQFARRVL